MIIVPLNNYVLHDSPETNAGEVETSPASSESVDQETVESLLTDIKEQTILTNNILTGFVFFFGIVVGCLCMKMFFDRFHK